MTGRGRVCLTPTATTVRHLAGAALLAVLALHAALIPAGPAWAQSPVRSAQPAETDELMRFTYGVDSSAWYWEPQQDEELAVGGVSQRVSLRNPQSQATLPVAVEGGEPTKLSALRFDLAERGVPEGSTVTRFVLTIAEGTDPDDTVPTVNPLEHEVRACKADTSWSPGEADLWSARPEFADDCVTGVRAEVDVDDQDVDDQGLDDQDLDDQDLDDQDLDATWTFDLSPFATSWGEDTFVNHGVVLGPVTSEDAEPTETWQVNLLLPQRNDPNTRTNEYEDTADRATVEMSYVPGGADEPDEPAGSGSDTAAPPAPTGPAGGGTDRPADAPDPGAPPEVEDILESELPTDPADQAAAAGEPFEPQMPWYVWLLVPAALLAAALVRGALVEAPASTRPGGVIEAIRRNNTLRRGGGALPVAAGPLARLRATFSVPRRGSPG